jgi:hypothetical protein
MDRSSAKARFLFAFLTKSAPGRKQKKTPATPPRNHTPHRYHEKENTKKRQWIPVGKKRGKEGDRKGGGGGTAQEKRKREKTHYSLLKKGGEVGGHKPIGAKTKRKSI